MKYIYFAFALFFASMSFSKDLSLNGEWTLSFWKQPAQRIEDPSKATPEHTIKATVPGNVELDMLKAGLIKDPLFADHVYKLRKYEGYQWLYSRTFDAPKLEKGERAILNMQGVDTLADIFVNGKKIASTRNMFIPHKFDITDILKPKDNKIEVMLYSVMAEAHKYNYPQACIRGEGLPRDGLWVRKAPHMFGWDIMPRIVSAGLWRDVSIDIQKPLRLEDVVWLTRNIDTKKKLVHFLLHFHLVAPFDKMDSLRYNVKVSRNGKTVVNSIGNRFLVYNTNFETDIENADFWWPRNMGEPAMYDTCVELTDEYGKVIFAKKQRVGFRKVRLEYSDNYPDKNGKFQFYVNEIPLFAFGTNWVPVDAFHSRDKSRIGDILAMLTDLNCNMVRCWGGNVYECDEFYNFCDENGILVWQDFSMACSLSPQDEDFQKQIHEEATAVIRRLRNHPCIAVWCGNNETDISLNWMCEGFNVDPSKDVITRKILPYAIFREDVTRPFLPSSPYVSDDVFKNREKVFPAEDHLWGERGYFKIPFYKETKAKFVSEIGYHGCPNRESLEKFFDKEFVYPWTDKTNFIWNKQWRCKGNLIFEYETGTFFNLRNDYMTKQVRIFFGEIPTNLDDFVDASQFVQAEAKKYFIELFRTQKGDKGGLLWWNLHDGWPLLSDAVVDYYHSKKLAYYFIKRVQYNEIVSINDDNNVVCVNDTLKDCNVSIKITDVESGKVVYQVSDVVVPANSAKKLSAIGELNGQGMLLIEYTANGQARKNHFLYGKPPFDFKKCMEWKNALGIKRN